MLKYSVETEDENGLSPDMKDIVRGNVKTVRVFKECPPFAWGEVVAFFVGEDAEDHASIFVKFMNNQVVIRDTPANDNPFLVKE